jgi:hypothetical protein
MLWKRVELLSIVSFTRLAEKYIQRPWRFGAEMFISTARRKISASTSKSKWAISGYRVHVVRKPLEQSQNKFKQQRPTTTDRLNEASENTSLMVTSFRLGKEQADTANASTNT